MKWIGQHIYDLVSRFRDDVYLEDISSGTIASGGNLGLDSNNKIVKDSGVGATDLHGAGVDGSANQLLTDDGDGTITSETYLTFENTGNVSTLSLLSNEDTGDYFSILTTTHGATTINTVDDNSHAADLTFNVDGFTKFTSPDTTSGGVEIQNASASGVAALTIDNDNPDRYALYFEAAVNATTDIINIEAPSLTTGNALFIDANSLTTGSAISLDIDDAVTASSTKSLIDVDYDKAGVTADGATTIVNGMYMAVNDNATNHANSTVKLRGVNVLVDSANNQGTTENIGFAATVYDADVNYGLITCLADAASNYDVTMLSNANNLDMCTMATTTNGATTITTIDADASLAHFEIAADGNITLDAAGDIALECGDVTIYNAVNDGNPTISIGSSATERFEIEAQYESGAQGLDMVRFTTFTAGGSADDGRYAFEVDDAYLFGILDDGIRIKSSGNLEMGSGNAILSDSSGTTTLSNIDALDATTEATIEAAIDTLDLDALDVDDINLNTKTITITGDTDDTFSVVTGAAGVTSLTTVDTAGADGHLAMVADGNITLKPADDLDVQILNDSGTAQLIVSPNANTMFQMLGRGALFGPASAAVNVIARSSSPHDTAGGQMTVTAGSTIAGTTDNIAGGDLIIAGGEGKGTGAGGDIIFKTSAPGSSGSTMNTIAESMRIEDGETYVLTRTKKVTLTQANINTLYATPVQLVAGIADSVIIADSVYIKATYNTGSVSPKIGWSVSTTGTGASDYQIFAGQMRTLAATAYFIGSNGRNTQTWSAVDHVNDGIEISFNADMNDDVFSSAEVWIQYHVIDVS